jgi:uncharacterized protein Veg
MWKEVRDLSRSLDKIRANVENYVGRKVKLRANKGRKKIVERDGIIESVYPSVFIVKINGGYNTSRRVSYSYSDILTETVQITVMDREVENMSSME